VNDVDSIIDKLNDKIYVFVEQDIKQYSPMHLLKFDKTMYIGDRYTAVCGTEKVFVCELVHHMGKQYKRITCPRCYNIFMKDPESYGWEKMDFDKSDIYYRRKR
jgi:hypothetical protein